MGEGGGKGEGDTERAQVRVCVCASLYNCDCACACACALVITQVKSAHELMCLSHTAGGRRLPISLSQPASQRGGVSRR